uniref:NADP-dependent oxidoreductase domain-containing protein n=1 Tax=Chelonoidis abingdonii TaxID=106734 RepID=A0A8C0J7Z8_CHEAB
MGTYVELNTKAKMPILGLGTWKVPKSKCEEATKVAIEVGFRHIDGIADGTVKREEHILYRKVVFESLQLWSTFHRPELVRSCLEQSLKKLKFDYLDLFIIHNPMSLKVNIYFKNIHRKTNVW